jgi:hypothetical protein
MTNKKDKQLLSQHTYDDHNTLIALVSSFNDFKQNVNDRFCEVRSDIKEIKDGMVARVEILEKTKADRVEIDAIQKKIDDNIEVRVRSLETDRVTQREHGIVLNNVNDLENGQTRIYAWASALAFIISLVVAILVKFI